jgi:uncharacterized protein with GYD domain
MPRYLHHFSYTTESVKAMVASPQNRRERAAQVIEAGGGKLLDLYFTFGKYDGVALTEIASVALALGASGAFTKMHTTVLLTMEEATEAMQKAGSPAKTYHPPAS